MKKSLLLILAIGAFALQANAQQISKNAIGLRLGDNDGFGPEVNYQRALGENNRLELGFAWHNHRHHDAVKLTGIYQWVWNIDGGFNWYAGPGAGLGVVNYNYKYDEYPYKKRKESEFYGFITGDVGIEYNFDFPLLISLDIRPQINLGYHDDVNFDIGLSARYQF
ncbi:MAG TPA: hypothetical protein VKX34_06110 [Aequorivita sp.]|nr:hypothetical protein [Aequorivita sp.]